MLLLVFVLFIAVSCLAAPQAPARAQGDYPTQTPLPGIKATLDAAQARQSAGQAMIDDANAKMSQAAEYLRNGVAQQAQAQADIGKALAAVAAQNYEAIGEAIGSAKSDLDQLSATNAAQHALISSMADSQKVQASAYISATSENARLVSENQRLVSDNQTLSANNAAQSARLEQAQTQSGIGNVPWLIVFFGAAVLLVALLMVVLQRRHETVIDSMPTLIDEDVIDNDNT
jgi:hypothetical protein